VSLQLGDAADLARMRCLELRLRIACSGRRG
jgi:hypothetical protein